MVLGLVSDMEIKVLAMSVPKSVVSGQFPDFTGFDITKRLEVYAFGEKFIMTYDIFYDPALQDVNSFVHGELFDLMVSKAGFTLEDDFTEYKYHFVPKVSDGGLVISNVKERYNSQTPIYIELLNTLRRYVDEFYGIGKQSGEV